MSDTPVIDIQTKAESSDTPAVLRNELGQFAMGTGRPPRLQTVTDAYRAILETRGAEALAEAVYNNALHASKPSDRLAAVQEITDRVEGKAVQSHRIETALDAGAARALLAMAERLFAVEGDTQGHLTESGE